ncbi:MAG: DNA integrity scanning diadenylate cyclase DisA [Nanoarchaeota archaeon]
MDATTPEIANNIDDDKKDVQQTIIQLPDYNQKLTDEEVVDILRMVAPGTNLRTALEGIVKIGKGALIVVENEFTPAIIDGGFKINCRFTPQRLMELAKMDGAIILSNDMKKIMHANVLLTPDSHILSNETGTRHKSAERSARMTGTLVIAVSERKHEITLYHKNLRRVLLNSNELLRKTNEHIQLLEKQRELFDTSITNLTKMEMRNYPSLDVAIQTVQKGYAIQKIAEGIQRSLVELGKEGSLLKTRLKELLTNVHEETELVIKDYTKLDVKKSRTLLQSLSYDELLEKENITKSLAYETPIKHKQIKGWRVLNKTSLEEQEIALLVKEAGTLGRALNSQLGFYKTLLGEERGTHTKEEIELIKLNHDSF